MVYELQCRVQYRKQSLIYTTYLVHNIHDHIHSNKSNNTIPSHSYCIYGHGIHHQRVHTRYMYHLDVPGKNKSGMTIKLFNNITQST